MGSEVALKSYIFGFLIVFSALAYSKKKSVEFSSRMVTYTFCSNCETCTGVLLDERHILSSAHCYSEDYLGGGTGRYALEIYQGKARHENYSVSTLIYRFLSHPEHDKEHHYNDLMIINFKGNKKITFSDDATLKISPYGEGDLVRDGIFTVKDFKTKRVVRSTPLQFVAGLKNPHGTGMNLRFSYLDGSEGIVGKGDSGAPVYIEEEGEEKLLGVVSFINGSGTAVFATWLSPSLRAWIQSNVELSNRR